MVLQAEKNIQNAMRSVSEALRLDTENKTTEAYMCYLQSTQYIVQTLLADIHGADILVCQDSCKFAKLAQQCLDRIFNILHSLPHSTGSWPASTTGSLMRATATRSCSTDSAVSSLSAESSSSSPASEVRPASSGSEPYTANIQPRRLAAGPVELAEKKNLQLMAAYKARLNASSQLPSNRQQTTDMSLTLERRMAENMEIAKVREQALIKQLDDRKRRYEEEAARRVSSMQEELADREQCCQFYAEVLEFEQNAEWLRKWREALELRPEDNNLKAGLIQTIITNPTHPLARTLAAYQRNILRQLPPLGKPYEAEEVQQGLRLVVGVTKGSLDRLRARLAVAYPQLDNELAEDLVYDALDTPFFAPIWRPLLSVYRYINSAEETPLADLMSRSEGLTPADIGVRSRFCMKTSPGKIAYESAIKELQLVTSLVSPMRKLETLVRVSQLICKCVQDDYSMGDLDKIPIVGADDLIAILSYVILKSSLPQIISECRALEDFIHDGYLIGEEGYCLTSFLTSLAYLATRTKQDSAMDSTPTP